MVKINYKICILFGGPNLKITGHGYEATWFLNSPTFNMMQEFMWIKWQVSNV